MYMSQPEARNLSLWMATTEADTRPPVRTDLRYDVLIVGGGISGICTAYQLRNTGLSVGLIEATRLLSDVTGHTTGKLTSQHDLIYKHLLDAFGFEFATTYYEANEWAIRFVAETSVQESIDCDFVWDSAHVYCAEASNCDKLMAEHEACFKLNIPTLIVYPKTPSDAQCALRLPRQARFHPRRFLQGLVERAEAAGVQFYEYTRALDVREEPDGCVVETDRGTVFANHVVIATHYPIHDSGLFVAKLAPYRSYAMALDVEFLPEGMYISYEESALHSFRRAMFHDREILIVGGEKHKVGQEPHTEECYARVEEWARSEFEVKEVLHRWSTQDNWTPDRVPYIGRAPHRDRITMATGFGGWGMTSGCIAGRLIADIILDEPNKWQSVFDPGRLDVAMISKMVKENVNVAAHLIGDRLSRPDQVRLDMIVPGQGAIVQMEDERVCAFRDDVGELHVVSSACTHMGCQLKWNGAERSWDCPCHGSRFDVDGEVLHGPAVTPLAKREVGAKHEVVMPAHAVALGGA